MAYFKCVNTGSWSCCHKHTYTNVLETVDVREFYLFTWWFKQCQVLENNYRFTVLEVWRVKTFSYSYLRGTFLLSRCKADTKYFSHSLLDLDSFPTSSWDRHELKKSVFCIILDNVQNSIHVLVCVCERAHASEIYSFLCFVYVLPAVSTLVQPI